MKQLGMAAVFALCAGPGCVDIAAVDGSRYVEREEQRFRVSGRPDVRLSTFDGPIEIRSWDRAEVLVTVEKRGLNRDATASIRVLTEQTGDRVRVDVEIPPGQVGFSLGGRRGAALIVSLPRSADVDARSGDGAIDVEDVAGRIALHTGDGAVRGRAITGDLRVHTGDGSVDVSRLDGVLDASTGDGRIQAQGRFSSLRARSGDGGITVQAESGSAPAHDWDIATGDGAVLLELPDGFGAEIDAHTGDGRIHISDLTVSDAMGPGGRRSLRGRLGTGGRSLRIRSGDGSITLRRY